MQNLVHVRLLRKKLMENNVLINDMWVHIRRENHVTGRTHAFRSANKMRLATTQCRRHRPCDGSEKISWLLHDDIWCLALK